VTEERLSRFPRNVGSATALTVSRSMGNEQGILRRIDSVTHYSVQKMRRQGLKATCRSRSRTPTTGLQSARHLTKPVRRWSVGGVGPPPDDTGGSALALVARSYDGGLRRAVSGCLPIAPLAEELLVPRRWRVQNGLPFEFCHGSLHAGTGTGWQPCQVREHCVAFTNRGQGPRIGHWSRADDGPNPGFQDLLRQLAGPAHAVETGQLSDTIGYKLDR